MLGSFGRNRSAAEIARESLAELERYDHLGPLARAAIQAAHRELNLKAIISDFKTRREPSEWDDRFDGYPPLDLLEPKTDARLAAKIGQIVQSDSGKTLEQLTLVPRRLRRNVYR